MTALSTFPGAMSAGLNALSSPLGGSLPAPLLMQLLNRAGGGGMPGSLAPQIPTLPGAPRGAAGPVPSIPPAPQPPQNNLLSSLGGVAGIGNMLGGNGTATSASQGLFGSQGPLFGVGGLFGPSTGLENVPRFATVNGAQIYIPDEWGGMGSMFGGAGSSALPGAADAAGVTGALGTAAAAAPGWLDAAANIFPLMTAI